MSKWEGNNTYPETDKIIQICNLFNCTMDDLINEDIKDITMIDRKNKVQINVYINSLLDFVTKTINMFSNMKFLSILRCFIEMILIVLFFTLLGSVICNILTSTIQGLFSFIPWKILNIIKSIIASIIDLTWIIITAIVIIHIFKIRYLNYYEQIISNDLENDTISKEKRTSLSNETAKEKKEKFNFEKKEPHIIIRDKEPFAFLNIFAKIILYFVKFIATFIGLFLIFILIFSIIGLTLSISFTMYSKIFIGINIALIGLIIAIILILITIIWFILNSKLNIKRIFLSFLISIIFIGIGIGVSLIALKDIKIDKDLSEILKITVQKKEITYKENLVILDLYPQTYEYIVNNTLKNNQIIIENNFDPKFYQLNYYKEERFGMLTYNFYLQPKFNIKDIFDIFINDLKNNTLRNYTIYEEENDIKIIANSKTIDKLIENFSKLYRYDIEQENDNYIITNVFSRIEIIDNNCNANYNALTDEIICNENCKCDKVMHTENNTIEYICNSIDTETYDS